MAVGRVAFWRRKISVTKDPTGGDKQSYSLEISGQAIGYGGVKLVHSIPATLTVVQR